VRFAASDWVGKESRPTDFLQLPAICADSRGNVLVAKGNRRDQSILLADACQIGGGEV